MTDAVLDEKREDSELIPNSAPGRNEIQVLLDEAKKGTIMARKELAERLGKMQEEDPENPMLKNYQAEYDNLPELDLTPTRRESDMDML